MPSRPGEFHPEPLTDPDLTLSRHPARAIARRLPPSIEYRVPPGVGWTQHQLTRAKWRWPAPFAPRALPRFITTTKQSAPSRRIDTFSLAVVAACAFSAIVACFDFWREICHPAFWCAPRLQLCVLVTTVPLRRHRHDTGVEDLPATRPLA